MRRNTIVLAVILAALAGYWWFYERGKNPAESKDKLFSFKADDATGVALDYQGRAIVLQKDAQTNKWKLAAPLQAAADDAAVGGLLTTLSSAAVKRTVEKLPKEADLKNFGLEPPAVKVSITLKSGLTLPGITVGTKTPLGDSTYAQRSADPAVYLVDGSLGDALAREPEELRDRSVLPLPQEPLARLEINTGGKPIVLARDDKDQWKIEVPIQAPANAQAVNRYIFTLARLQARSFIDNPPDVKKYGMDKPAIKVTLGGAGGKTLGAVEAGRSGNAWFARREGDPTIFAIDENSYKSLVKQAEDFKAEEKKPEEKKAEEKKAEKKP
ncbi:MAG TPA: DUF4340 domain-containing protein [Candidatus Binatia bacterium]|nr:DUF4340 domain-containing protein [Candidatus Binatia bacterium]